MVRTATERKQWKIDLIFNALRTNTYLRDHEFWGVARKGLMKMSVPELTALMMLIKTDKRKQFTDTQTV